MANKEATIYLLDVGKSMWRDRAAGNDGPVSYVDQAKYILLRLLSAKIQSGRKTDFVALVLVGTDESDNALADGEQYLHVTTKFDFEPATIPFLRFIDQELTKGDSLGDIMDGFIVSLDLMTTHCKHYKYSKTVYILTDGNDEINQTDSDQLIANANDQGVKVNTICFGLSDDASSKSDQKISNEAFLQKFSEQCNGSFWDGEEAQGELEKLRSKKPAPYVHIRDYLTIGDPGSHPDACIQIPVRMYSKTAELKLPTAGKWSIPAESANIPDSQKSCKVVMSRTYKELLPDIDSDDRGEDGEKQPKKEEGDGAGKNGDSGELNKEDLIKAYRYGKTLVPFDPRDEEAMKYRTPKGLSILGFVDLKYVRLEIFMGPTYALVPDPDRPLAAPMFYSLLAAMQLRNACALMRFVRRDDGNPKLGLLFPKKPSAQTNKEYAYWIPVPFAEDIRRYTFMSFQALVGTPADNPLLKATAPLSFSIASSQSQTSSSTQSSQKITAKPALQSSIDVQKILAKVKRYDKRTLDPEETIRRVDDFIDAMDLAPDMMKDEDDGSHQTELHRARNVFNPGYQRLYQCITYRALNPELEDNSLPPMDPRFVVGIRPDPSVTERASPALEKLKEAFDVQKVEKKASTKRAWAGRIANDAGVGQEATGRLDMDAVLEGTDGEVKRPKLEGMTIAELTDAQVTEVGTVDPVRDFENMIKGKDSSLVDKAIEQMMSVIVKLVSQSLGDQFYTKAVNALASLRKGCILQGDESVFNTFLLDLKAGLTRTGSMAGANGSPVVQNASALSKHGSFWDRIVTEKVGLAGKSQEDTEAVRFFEVDRSQQAAPVHEKAPEPDEEDDFDLLE
ncbi:SPOC like C-terminal domain-containing protein [Cladochytrium replicatum]|nr:SPOC like C-terminal domain-containing protein [Cladochytrium replicatum]